MDNQVSFELRKMADNKGPEEERFNQLADAVEEFTFCLLDPLKADQQRREEFGDALDDILDDAIRLNQKKVPLKLNIEIFVKSSWDGTALLYATSLWLTRARGGMVLPEKLGGGVRPTSRNPYPIYDQNLRFLLPFLWPGETFDGLCMTVVAGIVALNISNEGLLLTVLLIMMKKELLLRNIPNSRLECLSHTLFITKMAKINTLFMTKAAEKPYPLGAAHTYIAHIREYPHGLPRHKLCRVN